VIRLVFEGALRHQTHLFIGTLAEFGITLITFPFLPKNCYDMRLIVMYSIHSVLCSESCRQFDRLGSDSLNPRPSLRVRIEAKPREAVVHLLDSFQR
jgi:hypothetical protein